MKKDHSGCIIAVLSIFALPFMVLSELLKKIK